MPRRSDSPESRTCAVCGGPNAVFSYQAILCRSCKSFFVRCASRTTPFECKKDGNCPIVPNSTTNCKGCRYRRCMELGMTIEDVGNLYKKREKEKEPAVAQMENRDERIQRYVGPTISLGCNFVSQATSNLGPKWFAGFFTNLAKLVLTKDCFGPQLRYFNIRVSLADAFANSRACFSKDEELRVPEEEGLRLVIAQNYCRIVVSFANFTSAIPELYYLSTLDRMKLIQNICLPVYHLQFFCWLHYETDPVATLGHIRKGVNIVSKTHAARVKCAFDFYEEYVAPLIAEENVSQEEMTLLLIVVHGPARAGPGFSRPGLFWRAIYLARHFFGSPFLARQIWRAIFLARQKWLAFFLARHFFGELNFASFELFHSCKHNGQSCDGKVCDCSEQGKDIIRTARGKYINILIAYQDEAYPDMSPKRKKDRLRKMLYFLTREKECIGLIQDSFTASILNNDDYLMGTLTYDLHLRVYK